jgi:excinuclease ABC subunit C
MTPKPSGLSVKLKTLNTLSHPRIIEALILEMNLIKKYDPKYNVMLKDDKTYPFIKITNERHPKLIVTRNVKKDKGRYFGPYPNVQAARETKKLLDRLYPLRKCAKLPDRVCFTIISDNVWRHAYMIFLKRRTDSSQKKLHAFLKGGYNEVKKELEAKMHRSC